MELFNDLQSGCEAGYDQPLLDYLRAKKAGKTTPPYIPRCTLMPLYKLCQLALQWHQAGFQRQAGELAFWLLPLEPFLPLWCPEKEYCEKSAKKLFSHLREIQPIPGFVPDFDVTLFDSPFMKSAFTLSGNGTSLGMIRLGGAEIRAMGPQGASLNFGIQGRGMNGWTRCSAFPEVWMEVKTDCKEMECKLDLRFVGIKPETPLSFAFYVKAESCQIGSELLKPKSLRRFSGEAKFVQLNQLVIESALPHKIQVIPLAGQGCFWDCEFLISFEIHPFAAQANFSIRN